MSLLDNIATRLGYSKAKSPDVPALLQATGAGQAYSIPDLSVPEAQEELYQRLSWVYGAVTAVANTAATATLNVKKVSGQKLKDVPNHDLELRLLKPNPLDSRSEFIVKTVAYRALTGNCYWWLNRTSETAPPPEVWVLPPHQIQPVPDGKLYLKGYKYWPGLAEAERELKPWEIVHFRSFHPRNWFVGLSPIEALATVAMGDLKAQEFNTNFFGKDNAKPQGALAFSDMVSQTAWDNLKADIKANWGGTKRGGPMMLRGVGQGGVSWVSMALSQKDMEFLASRTFTKEEIYSIFAPGLASVLSVNATEANAKSGKATFIEMAVWPLLVSIAEKITNDLLPCYGGGLVAEFDDIRVSDRVLEMAEQTAYATVHTVNEIRERFYDAKPLPDEDPRGELLPAQIGPNTPGPSTEDEEPVGEMQPMAPLAEEPMPIPESLGDEAPVAEAPAAALDAEAVQAEANALKEMAAWRRYAVRHGAAKAQRFGCEWLQADVAEVIRRRLQIATDERGIKAAFSGPFLIKAPPVRVTATGEEDPLASAKDKAEARLRRILASKLDGQFENVMRMLGDPPDLMRLTPEFWQTQAGQMLADVKPELQALATIAAQATVPLSVGINWSLVAEQAVNWARDYAFEMINGLNQTTIEVLQRHVAGFFEKPTTFQELRDGLSPWFGDERAAAISTTEVTRAAWEGEKIAVEEAKQQGLRMRAIWHTNKDELVCTEICAPLDGKGEDEWAGYLPDGTDGPPAHPRCRCWATHEWVH